MYYNAKNTVNSWDMCWKKHIPWIGYLPYILTMCHIYCCELVPTVITCSSGCLHGHLCCSSPGPHPLIPPLPNTMIPPLPDTLVPWLHASLTLGLSDSLTPWFYSYQNKSNMWYFYMNVYIINQRNILIKKLKTKLRSTFLLAEYGLISLIQFALANALII